MPEPSARPAVPAIVDEVVAMAHRGAHTGRRDDRPLTTPAVAPETAAKPVAPETAEGPMIPENSLGAFVAAQALGYRWAETDVRATADGHLVLAHDASLLRTAGIAQDIARATAAQLARVLLAGVAPVPSLEQVMDAAPHLHLNVDVKSPDAVEPLTALLLRRPELVPRLRLTSFSEVRRLRVVTALRRAGLGPVRSSASAPGSLACWLAATAPLPRVVRRALVRALARAMTIDSLQLPETVVLRVPGGLRAVLPIVTPALVDAAHAAGLQVHVWTVDDPERMHRLLDAGVDGIVTDDVAALVTVLTDRGQWPLPDPSGVPGTDPSTDPGTDPSNPAAPTGGQR